MLTRNADGSLVKNNAKLTMTKTMADELHDQIVDGGNAAGIVPALVFS